MLFLLFHPILSDYVSNNCITSFDGIKYQNDVITYYEFSTLCSDINISCGSERIKVHIGSNNSEYCFDKDDSCHFLLRYGYKKITDESHVCINDDKKTCSMIKYYNTDKKCIDINHNGSGYSFSTIILILLLCWCCCSDSDSNSNTNNCQKCDQSINRREYQNIGD